MAGITFYSLELTHSLLTVVKIVFNNAICSPLGVHMYRWDQYSYWFVKAKIKTGKIGMTRSHELSEMSWSTHVNTVIFWYRKILSGRCMLNNIHQSALIYSHVGTYIFYNKINLYCCFLGDGWQQSHSECSNCLNKQLHVGLTVRNWSSSNTQKALPEKNISLKQNIHLIKYFCIFMSC